MSTHNPSGLRSQMLVYPAPRDEAGTLRIASTSGCERQPMIP